MMETQKKTQQKTNQHNTQNRNVEKTRQKPILIRNLTEKTNIKQKHNRSVELKHNIIQILSKNITGTKHKQDITHQIEINREQTVKHTGNKTYKETKNIKQRANCKT